MTNRSSFSKNCLTCVTLSKIRSMVTELQSPASEVSCPNDRESSYTDTKYSKISKHQTRNFGRKN